MQRLVVEDVYTLERPVDAGPVVFDSPHSGALYPHDFGYTCPHTMLRQTEDSYVDDLFASAPRYGAPLLCALFPRSYIDVNRAVDDIDPELLDGDWPGVSNPSPRSQMGVGLVRRLCKPGVPMYDRRLSIAEFRRRIDKFYLPYHACLQDLVDTAHGRFGKSWHVNCHSMPSAGYSTTYDGRPGYRITERADFVLGDRDGTTCDGNFTHALRDFLKGLGYEVRLNTPYKGVELVRRHGQPKAGRHSIQIEINRRLYMNERTLEKSRNYARLKADLDKMAEFICDYARHQLSDMAAD